MSSRTSWRRSAPPPPTPTPTPTDEDHYGATVFAAPREEEITDGGAERLRLRRGLARRDYLALGTGELRALLDRFLAVGACKFVVVPVAHDLPAWLRELFAEVVAPIEAAG